MVFDGYKKVSIESAERNCRSLKNYIIIYIEFDENIPLKIVEGKFLSNNKNKSRWIEMLPIRLANRNILHAKQKAMRDRKSVV